MQKSNCWFKSNSKIFIVLFFPELPFSLPIWKWILKIKKTMWHTVSAILIWPEQQNSPLCSSILIYSPEIIFRYIKQKVSYFVRFCCIDLSLPDTNCHPCQQLHGQTQQLIEHRAWTHLPDNYQSVPVDS